MNSKTFVPPKIILLFFLASAVCVVGQAASHCYAQEDFLRIHFIDVGYGDAIFIEFPELDNMMIDAGERLNAPKMTKYLQSLNIQAIDTAVITHPHANHFEGFFDILSFFPVKRVFINGDEHIEEGYDDLLAILRRKNIPIQNLKRGEKLADTSKTVSIDVLHPDNVLDNPNNNSIVLWLKFKAISILLMADVGPNQQKALIDLYRDIQGATVIQVPHHGGPLSNDFIHTFADKIFIISTGPNQWGWPRDNELQKLQGTIYRTDLQGTIVLESDGTSVSLKTLGNERD